MIALTAGKLVNLKLTNLSFTNIMSSSCTSHQLERMGFIKDRQGTASREYLCGDKDCRLPGWDNKVDQQNLSPDEGDKEQTI